MSVKPRQYCTFRIDGRLFGVDVARVQEVLRPREMTPVPRTSDLVRGLINLRGRILTVIDLRARLGLSASGKNAMDLVVQTGEGFCSVLVDEVGEVRETSEPSSEPPPATMTGIPCELVSGVVQLPEELMLVLDIDQAVSLSLTDVS